MHRQVQTSFLVSWHFDHLWGLGGTEHSQGTRAREWESLGKEITLKQRCCVPPGSCKHRLNLGVAVCSFHWKQPVWAMWSAAFSRNLETEFEVFVGAYSSKRCKCLWSAIGPACSVLCWNPKRKVSPICIKEGSMGKEEKVMVSDFFFSHLSGAFILLTWLQICFRWMSCLVQLSYTPLHIPACCSELLHIPVLAWMKHASLFLRTALTLQCF